MKLGNDVYEIKRSYEILVNTAEWLVKKGKLTGATCPIASGKKRYLVNTKPKHRSGDDFVAPRELSNGLHVETHYSTASCISNARNLLERCGAGGNILKIE